MKRLVFTAFVLAVTAGPALATPFDGVWKLDVGRSKLTGDTFSYSKTPSGFTYSNGATVTYHFAVDGKNYQTISSRTVSWTKAADGGWDTVVKANGKVISKAHRTLSADGKILTGSYTDYLPDGTTQHESDVYTRVSGTAGLAGKWRDSKVQTTSELMTISTPSAGRFAIAFPREKETITGPANGSPVAIRGPAVPPGAMASYKVDGPRKWTRQISLHGKVYSEGTLMVAPDGKTLTVTSWVPGKQAEASVEVYTKQ